MDKSLFSKCPRCGGTLAYVNFYGSHEQFWGWKCLICGEIVDPVILANRQLMKSGHRIDVRRAKS
jgi:hypothetical protein